MEYVALYRKYRPKKFNDVIGQESIITILKNAIKTNKVSNAYIFAGTKGTGKTSTARIFANAVNCLENVNGDICTKCENCEEFSHFNPIDIIELDAASNNGVEEIRKINDNVNYLPSKLSKKFYIIDEAHMLTTNAWNALLKTVEEPPKHVVFIFATTEMHKIPATILSRCQSFQFAPVNSEEVVHLLKKVCEQENISYEPDSLSTICELSAGSIRDALSILDQVAIYSDNKIKTQDIYKVYGLVGINEIIDFFQLIVENNTTEILKRFNDYNLKGINFSNFVLNIINIITDRMIYLKTNNLQNLLKTKNYNIKSLDINNLDTSIKLLEIWQEAYYKLTSFNDIYSIINISIFKSLDLFSTNSQQVVNEPKQPKQKQETKPKIEPEKEELFSVEEIIFEQKQEVVFKQPEKVEKKKIKTKSKEVEFSLETTLLAIISNKAKQHLEAAKDLVMDIKKGKIIDKCLSQLGCCNEVLFASPNGIIISFNDEIDSKILNDKAFSEEFILATCKIFGKPTYILGFTPKEINKYKEQIKQILIDKQKLDDADIELLRKKLDETESIEQLAYNLLMKG